MAKAKTARRKSAPKSIRAKAKARPKQPTKAKLATKPTRATVAAVDPVQLGATAGIRQETFPLALAVSPDGTRIATGDHEGDVRVFDAATGACLFEARWRTGDRHSHSISYIAFSPDGALLAALTGGGSLCVAHLASGATWFETTMKYEGVAFSPDGRIVAINKHGDIELVDARDGTCAQKLEVPEDLSADDDIAWSPDGSAIVARVYDREGQHYRSVIVIDPETLAIRARHDSGLDLQGATLAFDRDGCVSGIVDVAPYDAEVSELVTFRLDLQTGATTVRPVTGQLAKRYSSPELVPTIRAAFLEGRSNDEGCVVDLAASAVTRTLPPDVSHVAASADGAVIVATHGVALQLYDAQWTPRSAAGPGLSSLVRALAFTADTVITSDDTGLRGWGLDGAQRWSVPVPAANLTPDGRAAVVVRGEKTSAIDLPSGRARPGAIDEEWNHGAVSPDGKLLAGRNYDKHKGCVLLYSLETGKLLRIIEAHLGSSIYGIAFSPDGKQIVAGSWEWSIALHETATGKRIAGGSAPRGYGQQSFAFSADGKLLASGDHFRTVRIWSLPKCSVLRSMTHQRKYIKATAFSPDGALLASCDEDSLRLWSVRTGDPVAVVRIGAWCLAFSPDGSKLAAGGKGEAWIYDVATLCSQKPTKAKAKKR